LLDKTLSLGYNTGWIRGLKWISGCILQDHK